MLIKKKTEFCCFIFNYKKMSTSRQKRCETQTLESTIIEISATGDFIINGKKKYADDVVGILRDVYAYYSDTYGEKYNKDAVEHLYSVIEIMDKRASEKHGYSGSKEEKTYIPWYL